MLPTCDAAGRLLQPDKPLTAIDATFAKQGRDPRGAPSGRCKSSWMSAADGGAVWSSVTQLRYVTFPAAPPSSPRTTEAEAAAGTARRAGPGTRGAATATATYTTHFVLGINVTRPFWLQRRDTWPRADDGQAYVTRAWPHPSVRRGTGADGARTPACANGTDAVASGCVSFSAPGQPLPNVQSYPAATNGSYVLGESPFVLLAIHGVLRNGWVVWEDNKYVSVSKRRFVSLAAPAGSVDATVSGKPGEVVRLVALRPHGDGHAVVRGGKGAASRGWTVVTADVIVGKGSVGSVAFS